MNFTLKTLTAVALLATLVVGNAHATNLWYDFEGDTIKATDKLTGDGSQDDGTFLNDVTIQTTAPWGAQSALFGSVTAGDPFNQINTHVTGTDLGLAFTMSAVINVAVNGQMTGLQARLFSNFSGSGPADGRFVFDFQPAQGGTGGDATKSYMRVILPDKTNLTITTNPAFSYGDNHTLTTTYGDGTLTIYVDGDVYGSKPASGTVDLGDYELMFGEDLGGILNEQLVGTVDDILILSRALSPTEVATLHNSGAAAIVPEPGIFAMLAAGLMMLLIVRRKR